MRLAIRREPFDSPDWLYELKYDGFRALALIESGSCRLVSRNGHVYKSFPGLRASLAQLGHEAILDGEIVCPNQDGRPAVRSAFPPSR
jgi:bifunctional non-homologous end joining protein LigD